MSTPSIHTHDVIGIGFGPSNLAVAGAFLENERNKLFNASIDINPSDDIIYDEFKWHPAMLLPGTEMQISFLKDLATLQSPQSPLTFISYLHSQNRLLDFINRGRTIPTRKEYSDYLSWAARYVQDRGVRVAFGEEVVALEEMDKFTKQVHSRVLSTGQHVVRLARNLIISPGGSPCIPQPLATTWVRERMIHSSTYMTSVALCWIHYSRNRPLRIAVIGSGQSAAEIVMDLHSRLTAIPVTGDSAHALDLIIRKGSSDNSPFVNEIFNPETTNDIYRLSSYSARQKLYLEYANANYSVIDPHTLELLYEIMYDQKVEKGISGRTGRSSPSTKPKFTILNHSEVLSAETSRITNVGTSGTGSERLTLILQQTLTQNVYESSYDAVFCATGYDRRSWLRLLANSSLGKYFGLGPNAQDYARLEVEAKLQENVVRGDLSSFEVGDINERNSPSNPAMSRENNTSTSLDWISDWPHERGRTEKFKLCISRGYRLLPTPCDGKQLQAGIYVQGLAEERHGLGDTLLSVAGVRAGKVMDDLCMHLVSNNTRNTPGARMSSF